MFKRRIILLMLLIIGILSSASFFSLLWYLDPYTHPKLAVILLLLSFSLALTSILSLFLYFFKKIYYRGEVGIYHIFTSVRQTFFVSVFSISFVSLISFKIPYIVPAIIIFVVLLFLELFIQGL